VINYKQTSFFRKGEGVLSNLKGDAVRFETERKNSRKKGKSSGSWSARGKIEGGGAAGADSDGEAKKKERGGSLKKGRGERNCLVKSGNEETPSRSSAHEVVIRRRKKARESNR